MTPPEVMAHITKTGKLGEDFYRLLDRALPLVDTQPDLVLRFVEVLEQSAAGIRAELTKELITSGGPADKAALASTTEAIENSDFLGRFTVTADLCCELNRIRYPHPRSGVVEARPASAVRSLTATCSEIEKARRTRSPLYAAALAHWRIAWLHPFYDGNGRTASALSYAILRAAGHQPACDANLGMRDADGRYRPGYLETLNAAHNAFCRTGAIDIDRFVDVFATATGLPKE